MALFDTTLPTTTRYVPPTFDNKHKFLLSLLGYKNTGQKNTFGRILGDIPGLGLATDAIAHGIGKGDNATDFVNNQQEGTNKDISQLFNTLGFATSLATGNLSGAVKGGTNILGNDLGFKGPDLNSETNRTITYNDGGKVKGGEDMVMIDKNTGKKQGEISYDERVFSKGDSSKMTKLMKTGDHAKLGKFVASILKKHEAQPLKEGDMKAKKGGQLSYKEGKEYDVSPEEIVNLKKLGYKFEMA